MGQAHAYAAVDLGAESGRVVKGTLKDGKLEIDVISRFPNGMLPIHGTWHWNFIRLYDEMIKGFKECSKSEVPIESIGVDTWGVDFALLADDKAMMGLPVAYRDTRTDGMIDEMCSRVPKEKIYEKTGIAFMKFNTLYQLLALSQQNSSTLKNAKHLLFVPDYFHYLFTGKITNEYTIGSTSQMMNVHTREWDQDLLNAIGVSPSLIKDTIDPGTVIGPITEELQQLTGLGPIPVVAPATHDTASAVASVPASGTNFAFISSGTWSLMGMEANKPISTPKAFEYNFANEGGVFNTTRFLKNIMGLWLVQRCRAAFDKEIDYGTLTQMAADAEPFVSLIDPDRDEFMNPASMTDAIDAFCKETGQPVPTSEGAYVRCCLETLAMQYRLVMNQLCEVHDTTFDKLHIVGGGTQNKLLNQFTADATGVKVITGPVEATVIGNIMVQAIGMGHVASLDEARTIIRNSFEMETFQPENKKQWDDQFDRFISLKG